MGTHLGRVVGYEKTARLISSDPGDAVTTPQHESTAVEVVELEYSVNIHVLVCGDVYMHHGGRDDVAIFIPHGVRIVKIRQSCGYL